MKYSLTLSKYFPHPTKIKIFELCKDKQSLFENFFEDAKEDEKQLNKLAGIIRTIELTSNLQRVVKKKFREIKGLNLDCKVYEAKSGDMRVYLFHKEFTGRVIVAGGIKGNQKRDIKKVKGLIKEYYNEK